MKPRVKPANESGSETKDVNAGGEKISKKSSPRLTNGKPEGRSSLARKGEIVFRRDRLFAIYALLTARAIINNIKDALFRR
jgi:hypothetical protein